MAPKSSKRTSKAALPAAKRTKQDPNLAAVLDAFKQADGLSPECRAMLEAGIPSALGTPAGERHRFQVQMIGWVDKVFADVISTLQDAVAKAESEASVAEGKKAELEGKATAAQATADAKTAAVEEREAALAAATGATKEAKAKLTAAQKAQKAGDAEVAKASDAKQKLEAAVAEHLVYLKTDEGFDPKQATAHMKKLNPIAKQLKLDDSLLTALPSASTQVPSKRGEFDRMVIEQLGAGIQGRVDELDRTLKDGESAGADRAAAVATAQRELEEAEEAEKRARDAVAAAKAEQKDAIDAMSTANAELVNCTAENATALSAKEEKAMAVDNFTNYNLAAFRMLRDGQAEEDAKAEKAAAPPDA